MHGDSGILVARYALSIKNVRLANANAGAGQPSVHNGVHNARSHH